MQIDDKIGFWKNKLLDLGKRNNLISNPMPKSGKRVSRAAILINSPSPDYLWSIFSESDGSIEFPIPSTITYDSEEDDETVVEEYFANGNETNQPPKEAIRTFLAIRKKSKDFTENKGMNSLYMVFGFLHWYENGENGSELRSPLLMVPVSITQESITDPVVISRHEDEIIINNALRQKLYNDFGITLPDFSEGDDWKDYLDGVEKVCKDLNWTVESDSVQISLFSYLKMAMFYDIEKNSDKIKENSIIRALNGETVDVNNGIDVVEHFDHDSINPRQVFSVVDADSSQQDAILMAKRGASFVLQGPPGTGKSQTITNIIAELIAEGKKVLFVSEKSAALEVVYKRLQQVGLGDFCLTLHNSNLKRKDILDQLNSVISLSHSTASIKSDAYSNLVELTDMRNKLNQYVKDIHTKVQPLGLSVFEVNGLLSEYEEFNNIDFVQPNAEKLTEADIVANISLVKELSRIIGEGGYIDGNPWVGCNLDTLTYKFRQKFAVDSNELLQLLSDKSAITYLISYILNKHDSVSVNEIQNLLLIAEVASHSLTASPEWLKIDLMAVHSELQEAPKFLIAKLDAETNCEKVSGVGIKLKSLIDDVVKNVNAEDFNFDDYYNFFKYCQFNYGVLNFDFSVHHNDLTDTVFKVIKLYEEYVAESKRNYELMVKLDSKVTELKNNKAKLNKCESEASTAFELISKDFDESVLLLDIDDILERFRTSYRSGIRNLKPKYRNDKKTILSCCKTDLKPTYGEYLELLDKISAAAKLKIIADEQREITDSVAEDESKFREEYNLSCKKQRSDENDYHSSSSKLKEIANSYSQELDKWLMSFDENRASAIDKFIEICRELSQILNITINENTNFEEMCDVVSWVKDFKDAIENVDVSESFIVETCRGNSEYKNNLSGILDNAKEWLRKLIPSYKNFSSLFIEEKRAELNNANLDRLEETVRQCSDNVASLEYYVDYKNAREKAVSLGIDRYLDKIEELKIPYNEIVPVYKKCVYRSWLDAVIPMYPSIRDFRSIRQEQLINDFRSLDKKHLSIAQATLKAKLISNLPNLDSLVQGGEEIALLKREIAKKRKIMPIRKLIASLPTLLPVLKPCMMMSPLSVSTYLGESKYEFDAVIFDEASQVRTEDAVCAIFRAKQVIIAGDSKQMPPTDFFTSSSTDSGEYYEDENGEVFDAGAFESLLDEASVLPTRTLLWHYRSKHEDLIAFSNHKIYNDKLITFPSSVEKAKDMGVEYVYVENGIYERGGSRGNLAEAEKIADMVFEHFNSHPDRSIGIIAFGESQQNMIEDALLRRRQANPCYENYFNDELEEPIFIKNLETVQGDERDTIIFSIGYAKDQSGKMLMNFGPLSMPGGERRLNVAITRARYNLKLVGSIMPTDIDVNKISNDGPKLLRAYIDFAQRGNISLLAETTAGEEVYFDSPFEESVYNYLVNAGFNVATQVGCSGYRIDLAVRHPSLSGVFAIGIECDGASYHSARTARERDRLRQSVLESMGWNIYRVWSTDWIKDVKTEGQKLISKVNEAIESFDVKKDLHSDLNSKDETDYLKVSTRNIYDDYSSLRSRYCYYSNADEVPLYDIKETMLKLLKKGFSYKVENLYKDTANYGYGWSRVGSRIRSNFDLAMNSLAGENKIVISPDGDVKLTDH